MKKKKTVFAAAALTHNLYYARVRVRARSIGVHATIILLYYYNVVTMLQLTKLYWSCSCALVVQLNSCVGFYCRYISLRAFGAMVYYLFGPTRRCVCAIVQTLRCHDDDDDQHRTRVFACVRRATAVWWYCDGVFMWRRKELKRIGTYEWERVYAIRWQNICFFLSSGANVRVKPYLYTRLILLE